MIIPVHMLAFAKDGDRIKVREVEIPDNEWATAKNMHQKLELVFEYGQNDFQPNSLSKSFPSVSIGDVAEPNMNEYYMCSSMGWEKMSKDEFDKLVPPTSMYAYHKSFKNARKL